MNSGTLTQTLTSDPSVETLDDKLQKNLEFYIAHTIPNDSGIDAIINSAQRIGTFEQYDIQTWIFRGLASVGHILYLCRNPDRYLMCYANYPYQAFSTLDDAQKRILALDVLLHNKTSSVDQGEHQ